MVHLEDIYGGDGVWELNVEESQKNFVASRDIILARAYLFRRQRTRAFWIYDDETCVGIGLYHDSLDGDSYDLSQLLIDKRYQRRGYGKAAVELVLEEMRRDGTFDKVTLCYV